MLVSSIISPMLQIRAFYNVASHERCSVYETDINDAVFKILDDIRISKKYKVS